MKWLQKKWNDCKTTRKEWLTLMGFLKRWLLGMAATFPLFFSSLLNFQVNISKVFVIFIATFMYFYKTQVPNLISLHHLNRLWITWLIIYKQALFPGASMMDFEKFFLVGTNSHYNKQNWCPWKTQSDYSNVTKILCIAA